MKTIKVEYSEFTVTDETAQEILQIINGQKICNRCNQQYTEDNPEVSKNRCLKCILETNPELEYIEAVMEDTYIGLGQASQKRPLYLYKLIKEEQHAKGSIYFSSPNGEYNKPSYSSKRTLKHYGFNPPEKWTNEQYTDRNFYDEWLIRGDFTAQNVIMIFNKLGYEGKYLYFLAFKNGETIILNKRKKSIQQLFKKAEAMIEKDDKGHFFVNNRFGERQTYYYLPEWEIEKLVTELAENKPELYK